MSSERRRLFVLVLCAIGALLLAVNVPASADVIADWNERAVAAGYAARQGPPVHGRIMAMVHLAMFEAVNSIEPRYRPYRARRR